MSQFPEADMSPKLTPMDFSAQILPGTFEHDLTVLIGDGLNVTVSVADIKTRRSGGVAYHPAAFPKVVQLVDSKRPMNSEVPKGSSQPAFPAGERLGLAGRNRDEAAEKSIPGSLAVSTDVPEFTES